MFVRLTASTFFIVRLNLSQSVSKSIPTVVGLPNLKHTPVIETLGGKDRLVSPEVFVFQSHGHCFITGMKGKQGPYIAQIEDQIVNST